MRVLVDNREKKPWKFPGLDTKFTTLDVGDYTYDGFEHVFAVERKSLDDLANSVGNERERFENEIKRAQDLKEFAVVIEAPRSAVEDYADMGECPNYYSRIHPNSILGTVDKWPERYDTLSFTWEDNRTGAKQEALRLLDSWYLEHGTNLY